MRNWNCVDFPYIRWWHYASRLPMRNWNSDKECACFRQEELPDYLWGIETTSPVLEVGHGWTLPDYLWGIETQSFNARGSAFLTASRLPMRNWNSRIKRSACSIIWLPDYLWGIETRACRAVSLLRNGFQTTYEELKLCTCNQFGFWVILASRLPMRNWN